MKEKSAQSMQWVISLIDFIVLSLLFIFIISLALPIALLGLLLYFMCRIYEYSRKIIDKIEKYFVGDK